MISRFRGAPPLQFVESVSLLGVLRSKCRRRYQIWSAWVMPKLFGSKTFSHEAEWTGLIGLICLSWCHSLWMLIYLLFFWWGWSGMMWLTSLPTPKKIQPTSFSPERPEVSFCPDPKLLGQLFGMSTCLENGRLQQQNSHLVSPGNLELPSLPFTRRRNPKMTSWWPRWMLATPRNWRPGGFTGGPVMSILLFVLHSGKLTWQWKVDPFGRCFPYWTSGNSIVILVYWRANDSNHQFCGFHTFQEVVNPDTWVQNFWTKVIGLVHFLTAIFLRLPLAVRLEVVPSMASSPRSCSKLAMILRLTARCTRQSDRMWS